MNGSRPKPPRPNKPRSNASRPKPPQPPPAKRRRASSATPWFAVTLLIAVYTAMGLLMSLPSPPYWVWIATAVAVPLLVLGLNRPVVTGGKVDRGGLMAYLGGLIMVVALSVSANYIGNDGSLENVRLIVALGALVGLTLLAVFLTAMAAITSTMTSTRFMTKASYSRSITMVVTISFVGLCLGGVSGLLATTF